MNVTDNATWIPALSAVLWVAVRVLKDPRVPGNIPPRLRPFLVLLLATVAAIVDAVALGSTWREASIRAVIAAVTAIGFQETVIAGLLGNKTEPPKPPAEAALAEIAAIAGQDTAAPEPAKPTKVPPYPLIGGVLLCLALAGCASPIHMAAAVNNVAADTLNEAAPKLEKHCVTEVATIPTKEALAERKAECEPLTLGYDATAAAVGVLRAALLAAAGGDESGLGPAMAKVVAVAGEFAKKMGVMK